MQMEEMHSAVIIGRLDLLKNQDANNRYLHKNPEYRTYQSLGLPEEAKWDNILYHMAAVDLHPSRETQSVPKVQVITQNSSSINLSSPVVPWPPEGGVGIALFILQRKWGVHQTTERQWRESCLSGNQVTNPCVQGLIHTACSRCSGTFVRTVKEICLLRLWHLIWVMIVFSGSFAHIKPEEFLLLLTSNYSISANNMSNFCMLESTLSTWSIKISQIWSLSSGNSQSSGREKTRK